MLFYIFKHFSESPSYKSLYTPSCFIILDTAKNPIDLKLKEALYINKNKPNLNKQVHHFNTFLALQLRCITCNAQVTIVNNLFINDLITHLL